VSLIVGPKILFLFDLLYSSVAGDKNKLWIWRRDVEKKLTWNHNGILEVAWWKEISIKAARRHSKYEQYHRRISRQFLLQKGLLQGWWQRDVSNWRRERACYSNYGCWGEKQFPKALMSLQGVCLVPRRPF
jgi:hypothetical protein